jgi:CRP-like cAMP-binding protein
MTVNDEVRQLLNVDLFADVARERLRLLALTGIEPVAYEAGEALFSEGDVADSAYVIIEGSVDVMLHTPRGEVVTATIGRNGIVGETSMLCATRRSATVRATSAVKALRIDQEAFEGLLAECPDVAVKLLRTVALKHDRMIAALLRMVGNPG